eukprot:1569788-Rhodomonas_salina.1
MLRSCGKLRYPPTHILFLCTCYPLCGYYALSGTESAYGATCRRACSVLGHWIRCYQPRLALVTERYCDSM